MKSLILALAFVMEIGLIGMPAAPLRGARAAEELAHGVIVDSTNPRSMRMAREAGFTHAKMIIFWDRLEHRSGQYAWMDTSENDLDNVMKAAREEELKLVVRVDGVPGWAGGSPANADTDAVARFYEAMAAHGKGVIAGYEILNEPNLPFEWGGPPDPTGYAAFLKAAYRGVKRSDPEAVVIGGGVSPATGGAGGTMEDFDFLHGMYRAGVKGHMDSLSVHNYGGNHEPELDPGSCTICFRRAERYRQVMVEHGDGATAVWATEFGWLMDPGRNMGQYNWMRVSADMQAEFVVRAYRYAKSKWPWMGGMLLSNLDASTSGYHQGPQNGMPWFAILNPDYSPRPAYTAFKSMRDQEPEQARRSATVRRRAGAEPNGETVPATPPNTTISGAPPAVEPIPVASPPESAVRSAPGVEATAPKEQIRVRVVGTDGEGLSLRNAPSANASRIAVIKEGTVLELVGEDREASGRTWRNVREPGGAPGWAAADYLERAP